MPRLLKNIEANIISLFGGGEGDFTAPVYLLQSVVGEAGIEDYIELETFTALTQDFSQVGEANFCDTTPTNFGLGQCTEYEDLIIGYKEIIGDFNPLDFNNDDWYVPTE